MTLEIRDPEFIGAVRPRDLASYLRATGWQTLDEEPGRYSVWGPNGDGAQADLPEVEIIVPASRDIRDYALRVGDAVRILSEREKRTAESVLVDVKHAAADVVRIRLEGARAARGEIPLNEGANLISGSNDLMFAAACAAVQRRRYYHTRRPPEAVEYMRDRVRLGQTERGSFVVTLISELPVGAAAQLSLDPEAAQEAEPFERRVTTTLRSALGAAASAADRSLVTGDLEAFDEAVELGVSANLCAAIASTAQDDHESAVGVEVSWAVSRPVGVPGTREPVRFTSEALEVFGEAAKALRSSGPFEDHQVFGPVERLDRAEGEEVGAVTIATLVLDRPARVRVLLDGRQYAKAIRAHDGQLPVTITGTLVRSGRQWELHDPGTLTVVEPVAEEAGEP